METWELLSIVGVAMFIAGFCLSKIIPLTMMDRIWKTNYELRQRLMAANMENDKLRGTKYVDASVHPLEPGKAYRKDVAMRVSRMFVVLCVVSLVSVSCALPGPATDARRLELAQTQANADKAAANASAMANAFQLQIDALRDQHSTDAAALASLTAKLDQANGIKDQNTSISSEAQKKLDELAAKTASNEARWVAVIEGINAGSTVTGAAGSVPSPLSPWLLAASGVLAVIGVAAGKIHSALVSTPKAIVKDRLLSGTR